MQAPDYSQSFNRYSYVWNNPLKYTDPDGELIWLAPVLIGAAIGGYSGYRIGKAKGATGWGMAGYIFGGAAIGGIAGYAGFSVFSTAMAAGSGAAGFGGGIATGFNAGFLSGMASGAITGAGMTALGGGSFGDVLTGAAMGALFGGLTGAFSGAIAGGFHNMTDQLNFWGTRLSSNTNNLLASGNPTYLGSNNGWLPMVTVRSTNLMVAVAVREGMSQAAGYVFQGALIMTSVMSVGTTAALVGAIGRAGVRYGSRGVLAGVRGVSKASDLSLHGYVRVNSTFNYYKKVGVDNLYRSVFSNSSMQTKKWIINSNLHTSMGRIYNTNYEIFGPLALKNTLELYDNISNMLRLRLWP